MPGQHRFGDYQRESRGGHECLSLNDIRGLRPSLQKDADGRIMPYQAPPIRLTPDEAIRLPSPYVSVRFMEQFKAVVPLALYLTPFQILFLQHAMQDPW